MLLLEEDEVILEIQKLLEALRGTRGHVVSDHDHNLLMNITGHLTDDADLLRARLLEFLNLPRELKDGFIAARRSGRVRTLSHFLSDKSTQSEVVPLVESLIASGGGSLRKGMMERFPPQLV